LKGRGMRDFEEREVERKSSKLLTIYKRAFMLAMINEYLCLIYF